MKEQYSTDTSTSHIQSPYNMVIKVRSDIFQKYRVKMEITNIQEDVKTITVENSKVIGREQENETWFDARKMLLSMNDGENGPIKIDLTKIKNDEETSKKVIASNLTKGREIDINPLESLILRKSVRLSNNLKDTAKDSFKINNDEETNNKVIPANLTKIRKTKRTPLESFILRKSVRFSNNLKDAVRTICQVCQASVTLSPTMRTHTRNLHNMEIKEYRKKFGDPMNEMVEVVKHRCGICSKELLLHSDVIFPHVKKHNITQSEYTKKYMVLSIKKKPKIKQFNVKKSLDKNYNEYSEEEMIAEMQAILDEQI